MSEMSFHVGEENTEIKDNHYSIPVFLHGACHTGLGRDKQWRCGLVHKWNVSDDVSFAVQVFNWENETRDNVSM